MAAAAASLVLAVSGVLSAATPERSVRVGLIEAESRVDDVLVRSGRDASYRVFAQATNLRTFIESFRLAAGDSLDGPARGLTLPQQQLLTYLHQAAGLLTEAAGETVAQASETLRDLPRVSEESLVAAGAGQVLTVGPAVLSPPTAAEVHFTVRGTQLQRFAPRLFIGGTEASRVALDDRQAVFAIPSGILVWEDTRPAMRAARLVLGERQCSLRIFCRPAVREYPVALLLLPARLATVKVTYNRKVKQPVYDGLASPHRTPGAPAAGKVYSRLLELSSDDLTLMHCSTQTQSPHAPGYLIDTASLHLAVRKSGGETRSRVVSGTAGGFGVELCAQAQIHRLRKTRGAISVRVAWKEYRMDDVVLPEEQLPAQVLRWNSPLAVSLPANVSSIAVQADYFDGSHVTYTDDAADDYLELRWDRAHGELRMAARNTASIDGID
jgi:hypothetical protein